MQAKSIQVILAVICSALTGWFIGHQVTENLVLSFGVSVATAVLSTFLFYKPWEIVMAVPKAWRAALQEVTSRNFRRRLRSAAYCLPRMLKIYFVAAQWSALFALCIAADLPKEIPSEPKAACIYILITVFGSIALWLMILSAIMGLVATVLVPAIIFRIMKPREVTDARRNVEEFSFILFTYCNLLNFETYRNIWHQLCKYTPQALEYIHIGCQFICLFLMYLYVAIHSSFRVIVMADAALTAGVIWWTSDLKVALAIATLGGIWGAINCFAIAPQLLKRVGNANS